METTIETTLRETTLAYLRDHNVMTLVTSGPEGPWGAAVFYVNDGFDLFFLSAPGTRHGRDMAAQPRVAATIQEDYSDWQEIRGVQLEGNVRELQGVEREEAVALYVSKFPYVAGDDATPDQIAAALAKVNWYRITPERLYFIDNSKGLGHRDVVLGSE